MENCERKKENDGDPQLFLCTKKSFFRQSLKEKFPFCPDVVAVCLMQNF